MRNGDDDDGTQPFDMYDRRHLHVVRMSLFHYCLKNSDDVREKLKTRYLSNYKFSKVNRVSMACGPMF